jgi:hypothetical protein
VPVHLVDEVRLWVTNHKRLKELIREVSKLSLALLHRERPKNRGGGKKKGQKSRT